MRMHDMTEATRVLLYSTVESRRAGMEKNADVLRAGGASPGMSNSHGHSF